MPLSFIIVLITTLFFGSAYSANHMVYMGGGGEPNKDTTIFDNDLKNAADFVHRSRWETRISFNGGHSETEKIAERFAAKSRKRNTNFTPENYEALISEYERKIETGQIKSGDQLLLMISSHGSQGVGKTHQISTSSTKKEGLSDLEDFSGSPAVSLDRLEKLTQLAEAKGIKLGIVDFSCHSGVTQKLANKNTCVITSTGPNHFAWAGTDTTFAALFTKKMKEGKSLEDVFLETMEMKKDTSFPMISSTIGNEIQDTMYPLITPYLHDTRSDITITKLKRFYKDQYDKNRCEDLGSNFETLINFTYDIENVTSNANYSQLRNLLTEYNGLVQGIVQNTKFMNSQNLQKREEFCESSQTPKVCLRYTLTEMLNTDIDEVMKLINEQINLPDQKNKNYHMNRLKVFEKINSRKNQLLQDQSIKIASNFWDKSEHLKSTTALAKSIAKEAQAAYVDTYKSIRRAEGAQGPCAQIKF